MTAHDAPTKTPVGVLGGHSYPGCPLGIPPQHVVKLPPLLRVVGRHG